MNKIFKKVISLALIGTLCIGASTTTFASELSPEAKKQEIYTGECPGTSLMQNIMNPGDFF